jgi:hypothetical protein
MICEETTFRELAVCNFACRPRNENALRSVEECVHLLLAFACLVSPQAGAKSPDAEAYLRMLGTYSGVMTYHDDSDNKDKSMVVDLNISTIPDSAEPEWKWRYNFNPPQYADSLEIGRALEQGKVWQEVGVPKSEKNDLSFKLRNWDRFRAHRSDWFEIKRFVERGMIGGNNVIFRRRYSFRKDGFLSEKWLKYPGKNWFLDHRMDLKRKVTTAG